MDFLAIFADKCPADTTVANNACRTVNGLDLTELTSCRRKIVNEVLSLMSDSKRTSSIEDNIDDIGSARRRAAK